MMDMGDGHQWIQPELRLMRTMVWSLFVTKGTSWSMLTLRCMVRWKNKQEEEGERRRKRNREEKIKEGRLEFNRTSKANFYF